jgi:hypothetical protein
MPVGRVRPMGMAVHRLLVGVDVGVASRLLTRMVMVVRVLMVVRMDMGDRGMSMLVDVPLPGHQPDSDRHHDPGGQHEPLQRFPQDRYGDRRPYERTDGEQGRGPGRAQSVEGHDEQDQGDAVAQAPSTRA